jgi:hypothetical protein
MSIRSQIAQRLHSSRTAQRMAYSARVVEGMLWRRSRYSWRPWWAPIRREAEVHPHSASERPELFEAFNTGSTEFELLNWLHATIRLIKPERVVETGSHDGLGTIALATACRANGLGCVHSIEIDPQRCAQIERRVRRAGLMDYAQIHCADSMTFLRQTDLVFDMGFYDSLPELRAKEFAICLERGSIRKLGVFHDTSPERCDTMKGWPEPAVHAEYRRELDELAAHPRCCGRWESELSRGFVVLFLRGVGTAE